MIVNNLTNRVFTSSILFLLILLMINYEFILIYILIVFSVLGLMEFLSMTNKIFINTFYKYLSNIIFSFYLFIFCFFFIYFSNLIYLKIILYLLLFSCIASDIGGYVFGKIFKGPKITKISPKKTYSGSLGSFLFTFIILSSGTIFFTNNLSYSIFFISILVSLACQVGDLFFSLLKRKANIKDTGDLLPGHGGVLDRVDGLLIGIPIGFLTLIIYN